MPKPSVKRSGKGFKRADRPRVAVIVETAVAYGREIHEGIASYVREHGPWSMYLEQRELGGPPPRWLTSERWDGILSRPTTPSLARTFRRMGVPAVDLNDLHAGLKLPRIHSDNAAIGALAATHLIERGFRTFAFCGFSGEAWSAERRLGFERAVASTGASASVYESAWRGPKAPTWHADQRRLTRWLSKLAKPVGVATCNDLRGQQVLEACRRAGLAAPEQVAVIGVDNDELLCRLCDPPLSTVVPDARRIGYEAAKLLDSFMSGAKREATEHRIGPVGVITRQSTETLAVDDAEVAAALRFIREHACKGIRVEDVLREIPISRSLMERRFRRVIGRSPHAEIRAAQIERARQLLLETDLPLKRIATLAGFEHMEYLSQVFKRAMGLPPMRFRRTRRSGQSTGR